MANTTMLAFEEWISETGHDSSGWDDHIAEYFSDTTFFQLEAAKGTKGCLPDKDFTAEDMAEWHFTNLVIATGQYVMETIRDDKRYFLRDCSKNLGVPEKLVLDVVQDMILFAANYGED